MSNVKKLLMAAAGGAGGAGLDVDEVFSTYLYDGNSSTQTITNGIDLSGEGGLVWLKSRNNPLGASGHRLFDTERGVGKNLQSDDTTAEATDTDELTAFNSNGFSVGADSNVNYSGMDVVSWTFRKAPKFFDVVTFTGTGSAQTISHNLGSVPGMIIVKRTNSTAEWRVYHRSLGYTKYLALHSTDAATTDASNWQATPTSSVFSVGSDSEINGSGSSYVAYLFAHNNSDGNFGPDADQDIIKCGSYTGNGSSSGVEVDLGFEPQWVLIKSATSGNDNNWHMYDNMRGITTGGDEQVLYANASDTEYPASELDLTATGFKTQNATYGVNTSGTTYIYIAIRRGPLAEPTSASDVFSIDTSSGTSPTPPAYVANHLVDFAFFKDVNTTGNWQSSSRLTQEKTIQLNNSNAEASSSVYQFDFMNGWVNNTYSNSNRYAWMWKRAPSYFDVVAYSGNGTAGRTISHNLGVAPEMMWVKDRSSSNEWAVYHSGVDATAPEDYRLYLNSTAARVDSVNFWNDTAPTNSNFTVGNGSRVNSSGDTYIAYLFATVAGVSKVGSFSHTNGSGDTNVDCGFSNGSKLVIVKNVDATAHWYLWDSARGIVSGNESYLRIHLSNSQVSADFIDPLSSGFTITSSFGNVGSNNYIFYAIAA